MALRTKLGAGLPLTLDFGGSYSLVELNKKSSVPLFHDGLPRPWFPRVTLAGRYRDVGCSLPG